MSNEQTIKALNLGDVDSVEVTEILVEVGETIEANDPLVTLESQKTAMELPSPYSGTIKKILVNLGDQVSEGADLAIIEASESAPSSSEDEAVSEPAPAEPPATTKEPEPAPATVAEEPKPEPVASPAPTPSTSQPAASSTVDKAVHASPSVRRYARELGADINQISGTGEKGRIQKSDVQNWIKNQLQNNTGGGSFALPNMPVVDFSKFGSIENKPLSRIQKFSSKHLHNCWITIPHVTQQGEADITELEAFRQTLNAEKTPDQAKLSILPLLMKAMVSSLKAYPTFNASLSANGEEIILKQYYHLGVAVDTPSGLVVPVIRDVDQKSIRELGQELINTSQRARDGKLTPQDMEGGTFTISSLGGIGGTSFTPIINAPEVAILGVSRASMKPVYKNGEFIPRLTLPLSVSYDHRVIDGAEAARFIVHLGATLTDLKRALA